MSAIPNPPSPYSFDASAANIETDVLQASLEQPIIVNFWTSRSEGSVTLGALLEQIVDSYHGALKLARVNVDTEQQLAGMFGIRSIPTVVLVREGQIADGFAGDLPEAEIREFLSRHAQPLPAPEPIAEEEAPLETPTEAIARLTTEIAAAPEKPELRLDLAVALMQSGDTVAAEAELDALPANLAGDDRARRLRGQLEFASVLKDAPSVSELELRIARDPADFAARDLLGVRLLIDGQAESGLEQFLEILKADRNWQEGQAKKRLIAAFMVLDDADLIGSYRRRMSSLLF